MVKRKLSQTAGEMASGRPRGGPPGGSRVAAVGFHTSATLRTRAWTDWRNKQRSMINIKLSGIAKLITSSVSDKCLRLASKECSHTQDTQSLLSHTPACL